MILIHNWRHFERERPRKLNQPNLISFLSITTIGALVTQGKRKGKGACIYKYNKKKENKMKEEEEEEEQMPGFPMYAAKSFARWILHRKHLTPKS